MRLPCAEDRFDDLLHRPLAVVAASTEERQSRRQVWPEAVGQSLRRNDAPSYVPATRTGAGMALMFGDDRQDIGQFGHLEPIRITRE